MKRLLLFILSILCVGINLLQAQCSGGYTKCNLNWDYLDFFPSAGISPYTNLARSQTQYFTLGTNRLTMTHNFTGSNALGEDASNTAETGSYGTGEDVHFMGDGAINVSMQSSVDSIRFSIYDIDYNQRITITSNAGTVITLTSLSGSVLTIAGSGTNSASATAAATTAVNNSTTDGTINVLIVGTSTSFSITASQTATKTNGPAPGQEDGSFWLSDISACSAGTFSNNFFQVARPYTNQPGYVITVRDNNVYYVNPANGQAKFLFTDPGHTNLNSLAYDPVNRYLYYVYSLTGSSNSTNPSNKALRRYDYNVDTFGVVISDITSLLPTFDVGVESGAAAFYDGSLYLGIESSSGGSNESIIWKIDFNTSGVPVAASQVYGIEGANHDWADIAVVNGVLYDFDGSASAADFYHMNLYSHAVTHFPPASGLIPRQVGVDWNNVVYNIGQPSSGNTGHIAPYQYNGSINTSLSQNITYNGVAVTGSWGDAAEAFKPRVDFGDAPVTYDPVASDPAVHETSQLLRLGANVNNEWVTRGQTAFAYSDNFDDGLVSSALFNPSAGNFFIQVSYLNNTGQTATICAWVDFNGNGVYDAGEGITQTNLPSNASVQTANLTWSSITTTLVDGSYTYMRIRISNSSNNMTTANPTGYFGTGEVEDYWVPVASSVLGTKLLQFNAEKKENTKVAIQWQATNEEANTSYTLERSSDLSKWTTVSHKKATGLTWTSNYNYVDTEPIIGTSYYRLKVSANSTYYSATKKVIIDKSDVLRILPNPISPASRIMITSAVNSNGVLNITDNTGKTVYRQNIIVKEGTTSIPIGSVYLLLSGTYYANIQIGSKTYTERFLIKN